MFGWVLRLGLLRLCTAIFLLVILPTCSGTNHSVYLLAILTSCAVVGFVCLDRLANCMHIKQTNDYGYVLWYCSLICMSLFRLSSEASALSSNNAEIMTFVNMKTMYTCIYGEIYCFLKLIYYMARYVRQRFGLIRSFFYAIYLHINALLLIYGLCVAFARISLQLQNGVLKESNFFHESVSVSDILDGRPYIQENGFNSNNVIDEFSPDRLGAYHQDYVRYLGEDIQIECSVYVSKDISLKMMDVYLVRNGKRFKHRSDRIKEQLELEDLNYSILVKMKLTIRFLEQDDFGLYQCVYEDTNVFFVEHQSSTNCMYISMEQKIKWNIGDFLILRAKATLETVEFPVGITVSMKHYFYITEAPVDEISFEYRINGHDIHDICLPDMMSCTLSAILYALWTFGGYFREKFSVSEFKFASITVAALRAHMCVCGRFYGEHSLVMHIPYFNVTTGKEEIVEILHEKKINVQPISWWRNASTPFENFMMQPDHENSSVTKWI